MGVDNAGIGLRRTGMALREARLMKTGMPEVGLVLIDADPV
jgi:hypothetical protein